MQKISLLLDERFKRKDTYNHHVKQLNGLPQVYSSFSSDWPHTYFCDVRQTATQLIKGWKKNSNLISKITLVVFQSNITKLLLTVGLNVWCEENVNKNKLIILFTKDNFCLGFLFQIV